MSLRHGTLLLIGSALGGCGGDGGVSPPTGSGVPPPVDGALAVDAALAAADLASPGAYPAGPYGVSVGDVLPDLPWVGYRDDDGSFAPATRASLGPYSMDDLRRSGREVGIIHLAEPY
jgi:hypothetical protein